MTGTAKLRFGDVEVERIGLGTNRLRNTPANVAFLREAVAAGIGHIDTAHTYTGGESEKTIGEPRTGTSWRTCREDDLLAVGQRLGAARERRRFSDAGSNEEPA